MSEAAFSNFAPHAKGRQVRSRRAPHVVNREVINPMNQTLESSVQRVPTDMSVPGARVTTTLRENELTPSGKDLQGTKPLDDRRGKRDVQGCARLRALGGKMPHRSEVLSLSIEIELVPSSRNQFPFPHAETQK